MVDVTSRWMDSLGYDLDERVLYDRNQAGSTYGYRDVPPRVYAELMNADDLDAYFDRHVSDHYPVEKITKMTPVHSESLRRIGYNPDTGQLYLTFVNGATYAYDEISPQLYAELMNAHSMGAFVNQHIRNRFPYRKVWEERFTPVA